MNLLPVVPNFNTNLSSERYFGYHSFENVNCKYSNYDKLSEFSRLSNGSYQINNTDRSQNIRNSRYYQGDLMQVVIEPNKFHVSSRVFNDTSKICGEFDSTDFLKTQNNVMIKTKPLGKRNCNVLPNDLNIKRVYRSEISNEYNEICEKKSHGSLKGVQYNIKAPIIDDDDLSDYFISSESNYNKSYSKPVCIESRMPMKLSEADINKEQDGLSSKYSVFEYGHKSVDIEKLPIVDPNLNKNNEVCLKRSNLPKACNGKSNKLLCGESIVNNNEEVVSVKCVEMTKKDGEVPVKAIGMSKNDGEVPKLENKRWKLIPIDCPLRVGISRSDVNLKNCSTRDPRLSHLRS